MSYQFQKGTYLFHKDPNMNYQLNRWMTFGNIPEPEIREIAGRIHDLSDWRREFLLLAGKAKQEGDILKEACSYRAVDFFMNYSDKEKQSNYERLVKLFREAYKSVFQSGQITEQWVDYDGVRLPIWYARSNKAVEPKGTILMTGGFDCYKEELVPVMLYFADKGYRFYYFEGPGQGEVLMRQHYPMTHEWEKPLKVVIDQLALDQITLIGLSLGGYLAPRAALYDNRVQRVIAWGTMYDFFDVVSTRRGRATALFIRTTVFLRLKSLMNIALSIKMKRDPYTFWGIDHGRHVMGVDTPYQYFRKLKKFSLKKIAGDIRQDILLMSGTEDHFIDIDMLYKMEKSLTGVRSLTSRIFTSHEKAGNHCQFGNLELALRIMQNWIELLCQDNSERRMDYIQ